LVKRGLEGDKVVLPSFDESFALVAGTAESKGRVARRIDDAALERDWHNDFAALTAELGRRLEATRDGEERRRLISRLRGVLED
jgi:hypothetical protein